MSGPEFDESAHTLTKSGVVERVREATGLSWSESSDLVEAVLEEMKVALESGTNVKISGFGTFVVRQKAARRGRNPHTSEAIVISRRTVLTFKPSAMLRQALNAGPWDPA